MPLPLFLYSSAVEHPAVNRRVVGSNPTGGARKRDTQQCISFFVFSFMIEPTTRSSIAGTMCREAHGGRDALSKQYGVLFVAKAGSDL